MKQRYQNDIVCRHISKTFGDVRAFSDVSFVIYGGEKNMLLGKSGTGKTTILRMIAGLEEADEGTITNLPKICGQRVAVVFQEDRLCENLSVRANIALAKSRLNRTEKRAFEKRIIQALTCVDLQGFEHRVVKRLSGGQKRRVALLRAVLSDADVMLFDEPLKGLDDHTKETVMAYLLSLLEGKTVLWVTHDRKDATLLGKAHVIELKEA